MSSPRLGSQGRRVAITGYGVVAPCGLDKASFWSGLNGPGLSSGRTVEIADMQEGSAVIKSGLQPGEKIVIDGQYRLIDGSHVKVDAPKPQAETPVAPNGKSG